MRLLDIWERCDEGDKELTRDQERFDETMFSILHTLKHVGNRFKRKEEGG